MESEFSSGQTSLDPAPLGGPWYKQLSRYHWYVFVVAALGWLFDTMDQRIFLVSRQPALTQLLGYARGEEGQLVRVQGEELLSLTDEELGAAQDAVKFYSGLATTIFMLGWATGGLYFGMMGDRWGRARTMLLTILIYSVFTGLSALSQGPWDFMVYRFITGLGVGGEFAAGVSLVAEVMPASARPFALGLLQALSAVGNIAGSLLSMVVMPFGWRYMFLVGTLPALLVVAVRRNLKEPETWQKAAGFAEEAAKELGSLRELLGEPQWRRRAIVGFLLALSGVIGLWGVGFWSFELVNEALKDQPVETVTNIRAVGTALQDVGAFFGIYLYSVVCARIGRRPAFAIAFAAALASVIMVFGWMDTVAEIYWMLPIMGFCTLSLFGGYAVYFPELFPTRLRSTGTGFCYNAARFIAALGPFTLGQLAGYYRLHPPTLLSDAGGVDSPLRYAALSVALIYFLGLAVLPFAPETRGKPLPE